MKLNRLPKKYLLAGAIISVCVGSLVYADDGMLESAGDRARSTLDRIQNPKGANLPNGGVSVKLPDDNGENPEVKDARARAAVPELPYYGHDVSAPIDPLAVARRFQNRQVDPDTVKDSDLLVFVSFSMPQASLRRIAIESKKTGAVMVLRGFKNGSLKESIAESETVAGLGAKLMIHPELFTQYQIQDVPTFVLATPQEVGCSNPENSQCVPYYAIKGDVSLHAVLERFAGRRDSQVLANSATSRLTALRGGR